MKIKHTIIKIVHSDLAILVTGISTNVKEIKESFSNYNVIFSTWDGEQNKYNKEDIVIYNDIYTGNNPTSFTFQKICTLNGLFHCKELGYNKILKIRSDLVPTNTDLFIDVLDFNKINLICCHVGDVASGPYFIDYMMASTVEHLINLWTIEDMVSGDFPEKILTRQFNKLQNNPPIKYILNELDQNNDLFWIKNNIYISQYKENNYFKY